MTCQPPEQYCVRENARVVSRYHGLRKSSGSLAMFAAIRRALAGCTPGAASIKLSVCAGLAP